MNRARVRAVHLRVRALVSLAVMVGCLAFTARSARADDDDGPPRKTLHPEGWGLQIGLSAGYLAQPPGITDFRTPSQFTYRGLDGTTVQPDSGAALLSMEAGLSYHLRTLVSFPLVSLRGAIAIGPTFERTFPSTPEETRLRMFSDSVIELSGPGLGLHVEAGNALLTASAQPVLEVYHARGTLTQGMLTTDLGGYGYSIGLDGDAAVCAQIGFLKESWSGDTGWGCLYASPFLVRAGGGEPAFWNGMLVGVRLFATSIKW